LPHNCYDSFMPLQHIKDVHDSIETTHELYKEGKLHRQVIWRLRIMALLVGLAGGIVLYDVVAHVLPPPIAAVIILMTTFIGIGMARIYKFDWSEEEELIVTQRMDWVSGLILVAYIILRLVSRSIIDGYYHNGQLTLALSLAALVGIALGRLIGMTIIVRRTYEQAHQK
jgi:peptidoglycan/LPS O-acetylase OafA/YrhL